MNAASPEQDYRRRRQAESLMEVGRWREAVVAWQQTLSLTPGDARLYCQLALCHLNLGERTQALDYADRAIAADPGEEWGFRLRSILLRDEGRKGEALAAAQEAVKLWPHANTLHTLVMSQIACEQFREARQTAQQLREIAPEAELSFNAIGLVALGQKCWREAEEHFRRALKINPLSYEAMNNLGVAALNQGRRDEAADYFSQATKLNPTSKTARNNLKAAATRYWQLPLLTLGLVSFHIVRGVLSAGGSDGWASAGLTCILLLLTGLVIAVAFSQVPVLRKRDLAHLPPFAQAFMRMERRRELGDFYWRAAGGVSLIIWLWWIVLWGVVGGDTFRPRSLLSGVLFVLLPACLLGSLVALRRRGALASLADLLRQRLRSLR